MLSQLNNYLKFLKNVELESQSHTCETDHDQQNRLSINSENITEQQIYSEVGYRPVPLLDNLRIGIIKRGSECVQNKEGPFDAVERPGEKSKHVIWQLTKMVFKLMPDNKKILRKWMVDSHLNKSLYCCCCKRFTGDENKPGISSFVTGFRTWWKLNPKVRQHENSDDHLANLKKWKTLGLQLKLNKTIDGTTQEVREKDRKKWNDLLRIAY